MKFKKIKILVLLFASLIISLLFNKFAGEINDFNVAIRTFATTGKIDARIFDENGFNKSFSPKIGEFVSPFYVMHYGIVYSSQINFESQSFHWRLDPSLLYWNIPPNNDKKMSEKFFKNMADWAVQNIEYKNGGWHYLYKFDWPYAGYEDGKLIAPWWSGLTDGYALILLLRAYDVFKDERYISVAHKIYKTINKDINSGGSIVQLNGLPWIEEYVDPSKNNGMAFVLNGMIYAYKGIKAYEDKFGIDNGFSEKYYGSILKNLKFYDDNGWSYYDMIGGKANIKYHKIAYALISDLDNIKPNSYIEGNNKYQVDSIKKSWKLGFDNPGLFFFLKGPVTAGYWHLLLSYIATWVLTLMLTNYTVNVCGSLRLRTKL
ncbi:hypothetical protein G7045_00415 [Acidovorax sp. HDW3]|uniref:D-glucuronyl C5-epimerase family protein n=1 Tax=Acidovorax sp. HDW3 TaxID=2714923 RepID=UPI00140E366E|nr:D-glucuronyl C5-epimerase family protein [Acidovorax sp. HDW3]QIL42839.1 hypothetical protein G7045_00415 [Acidovorax sp. HDW3]